MVRLNKTQIEHLTSRINDISNKLMEKELATKLPPRPVYVGSLSFEEQVQIIAAGKAKLRPLSEINHYTDLNDAYTYPAHEAQIKASAAAIKAWETKAAPIRARYAKDQQRMQDMAILGDSQTALEMLASLEAKLSD